MAIDQPPWLAVYILRILIQRDSLPHQRVPSGEMHTQVKGLTEETQGTPCIVSWNQPPLSQALVEMAVVTLNHRGEEKRFFTLLQRTQRQNSTLDASSL